MEDIQIVSLKQERAASIEAAQRIHAEAEGESRNLTAEERAEFDRHLATVKDIGERVDRAESLRGLEGTKTAKEVGIKGRDLSRATVDQAAQTEEYRSAFNSYLRAREGIGDLTSEQRAALRAGFEVRADMLTSSATHGGYVVPQDFANLIISAKVNTVAVRKTRAQLFPTANGQDLPVPVQSSYGAAAYLTEGNANTAVQDTGAKVTLKAFTLVTQRNVSFQLMQDSHFPMAQVLAGNIGNAFALKEDTEFIAGAGSTAVTGVRTAAVGETTGSGHVSSFTYAELLAWYYSVQPQYRAQGEFILADSLMGTLAGLVDTNSRPIWTAGQIPGEPDTLMGKPLYTSISFATPAAGTIGGVFGDFANGYGIREAGGVELRRSDDRYIDQLETTFVSWERIDGNLLDASALATLKFAAS